MSTIHTIKSRNELSPIILNTVQGESTTDFDLYINIGGHLVLYAPRPYTWSQDEISRLQQDGHEELFYPTYDKNKVIVYKKVHTLDFNFLHKLEPQQRIQELLSLSAEFNRIFQDHRLTAAGLEKGRVLTEKLTDCIQEEPTCIKALDRLRDHHEYTYYHCARVAAYSIAIAIEMSHPVDKELHDIAIGCLLHDIGKASIDSDILNQNGRLSEKEWEIVKQHPENGLAMVSGVKLGIVPSEIILHHHEREDGRGYPHGLKGNELLQEVKIAAFSDIFDALTSRRPYQKTRTRYEALDFIRFQLLDMVDRNAFIAMVSLLG